MYKASSCNNLMSATTICYKQTLSRGKRLCSLLMCQQLPLTHSQTMKGAAVVGALHSEISSLNDINPHSVPQGKGDNIPPASAPQIRCVGIQWDAFSHAS